MITRAQIQTLADRIAAAFDVERIILFGSHAYGTPTQHSDADLLVLMDFDGPSGDQRRRISAAVGRPPPCDFPRDIIVRTPADAARRYRQFDPLIREALEKGQTLYERRDPGRHHVPPDRRQRGRAGVA